MLEKGKVGIGQFTILVILFTVGSSIFISPSGLASEAKQNAWISAILGVSIGLLIVCVYYVLVRYFPKKTLVEMCEESFGKWIGKLVSFLYFIFFFILSALVLRNIGDFMVSEVMPETPIQYIMIAFLVVVIMGTRLGLETFTRTAEVFFPWVLLFFLFLFIFLPPKIHFNKMLPLLDEGLKPIIRGAIPFIGTPFLELVVLLMILPFVNCPKKAIRAFFIGIIISGILLILISVLSILVLGATMTARSMYPSYKLARMISIGHFLERLEVIMAGIWIITIYFKLTICFYASALSLAQICKLKEIRSLSYPLGMILIVLSIVSYPNASYFINFASKIWFLYSLTFGLLFPICMIGIAIVRKRS